MYKNLGKTIFCESYLKKANDGIFIECYTKDKDICSPGDKISSVIVMKNGKSIKDIAFEGDGEIKTLYELVEKKFIGVCVKAGV